MNINEETQKGAMLGNGAHFFLVVNLSDAPLSGRVMWQSASHEVALDVEGLAPGGVSKLQPFYPSGGHNDYWHWSQKGRKYQLNCYDRDRYAVVTISNYGIGVLPSETSPDSWKW